MDVSPRTGPGSDTFDLSDALRVLKERKWIIISFAILALLGSLAWGMLSTPMYRATAQILRQNTTLDQALLGIQTFRIDDQQRDLSTGSSLVKLDTVATNVQQELASNRSILELQGMVSVSAVGETNIIKISAVSADPAEASAVANSFARQFIAYRQAADKQLLADARNQIAAQLAAMTLTEQSSASGSTLAQKVEELAVLESMQTGGYELVQEAQPPKSAYSPRIVRNTAVSVVLGLVLGLLVAFLLHLLDRRLKDEDMVQKEFGAPVLATVPRVGPRWNGKHTRSSVPVGFGNGDHSAVEAFRTLRMNLKFFEVNRKIRSILVTSPLPREGKSVTTINLGLSLAMSGARVIILEADLRRPILPSYLGLREKPGFTSLLAGTHTLPEVIQTIDIQKMLPERDLNKATTFEPALVSKSKLHCVTAGLLPPNPAELLSSAKTDEILKELSSVCDYLLIDAPPVLPVSDALELASKVDSVVLVARLFSTTTDEARRARQNLERIGVRALGVVIIGAPQTKAYYHRYGEYYPVPDGGRG